MESVRRMDGGCLVDRGFDDDTRAHTRTVRSSEQETRRQEEEDGLEVGFSKSIHHTVALCPVRTAQHAQSSTSSL